MDAQTRVHQYRAYVEQASLKDEYDVLVISYMCGLALG
jgi:hypothetical protein